MGLAKAEIHHFKHAASSAIIIVKEEIMIIMIIQNLGVMHERDNTILSPNMK